MFCFHKWDINSKSITKSFIENMKEQGYTTTHICSEDFEKKQIVIFKCYKCGILKEKTFHINAIIKAD